MLWFFSSLRKFDGRFSLHNLPCLFPSRTTQLLLLCFYALIPGPSWVSPVLCIYCLSTSIGKGSYLRRWAPKHGTINTFLSICLPTQDHLVCPNFMWKEKRRTSEDVSSPIVWIRLLWCCTQLFHIQMALKAQLEQLDTVDVISVFSLNYLL